jgi:type III restriction enzyme
MPVIADRQRFRNEDLTLKLSSPLPSSGWGESRYEGFIDELCGDREYQKEAIRAALSYMLGGRYANLRALARANFEESATLERRYGSWAGMENHLQLPDQLSASLDLATGTGKSYVLYGIAAILLAEGAVDRVLVLCPSTTIETGLLEKFRELAGSGDLRDLLPADAKISAPHVINASETITPSSICIENYHAILQHVGSSIRQSLYGKGARVAVLNDETHHVANESAAKTKRWKEFLADPGYGFRYVIGVSGTCYVNDEYFADVIFRYSLRQAMEERYVKVVDYVAEMPKFGVPDEEWQLIHAHHEEIKSDLVKRKLRPLTIVVTPNIARCKEVAEELKDFLIEAEGITSEAANERVLIVYNNAPDLPKLRFVDSPASKVEWIVSVSMLNEGWDVKRVFQIVPHEERAFNSKLLIAQVLGRGLRIPIGWDGPQPQVKVFNHDAWAARIRHLVNEILEIEKRLSSHIIEDSLYHFDLHNIDYTLEEISVKKPMVSGYNFFKKGYIELASATPAEDVSIEFERAGTEERYKWETKIQHKTYTPLEIAVHMHRRLEEEQDPEDPNPKMRTYYTDKYSVERLEKIVKTSLARSGMTVAPDNVRQRFLQALGTLRRKDSENVRYALNPDYFKKTSTRQRQADSAGAAELRNNKTYYFTDKTRENLKEEQFEFFDEVAEPGSGYKCVPVPELNFKTPLNATIADHDPERRFIKELLAPINLPHYEAWIKSAVMKFYEIEYSWKKGKHTKRAKFNPDFFIKAGNWMLVVEVKGDEELIELSKENQKKNEFAIEHFERVNRYLEKEGSQLRYKFNFLTPNNFSTYFQYLREGLIKSYTSELDVKLLESE